MALSPKAAEEMRYAADVPINGMGYFRQAGWQPVRGTELKLMRILDDEYDPNAIAICRDDGEQIGWIPMSKTRNLAAALDKWGGGYFVVRGYNSLKSCPYGDVYLQKQDVAMAPPPPEPPLPVPPPPVMPSPPEKWDDGAQAYTVSEVFKGGSFGADATKMDLTPFQGRVFRLSTTDSRSSISIGLSKDHTAWFRKAHDMYPGFSWALVTSPRVVQLFVSPVEAARAAECWTEHSKPAKPREHLIHVSTPSKEPFLIEKLYADGLTDSQRRGYVGSYQFEPQPHQKDFYFNLLGQPAADTTTKDTTMNFAQTATTFINANKSAATTAGYMEAGRLANNQFAKLAGKHLPFMLRGYADTPVGKLVIANIAMLAAQQLRPNDPTLGRLTNAMNVQAFQAVYQTVDIEGFLDSLLSSPEIKEALSRLPKEDTPLADKFTGRDR